MRKVFNSQGSFPRQIKQDFSLDLSVYNSPRCDESLSQPRYKGSDKIKKTILTFISQSQKNALTNDSSGISMVQIQNQHDLYEPFFLIEGQLQFTVQDKYVSRIKRKEKLQAMKEGLRQNTSEGVTMFHELNQRNGYGQACYASNVPRITINESAKTNLNTYRPLTTFDLKMNGKFKKLNWMNILEELKHSNQSERKNQRHRTAQQIYYGKQVDNSNNVFAASTSSISGHINTSRTKPRLIRGGNDTTVKGGDINAMINKRYIPGLSIEREEQIRSLYSQSTFRRNSSKSAEGEIRDQTSRDAIDTSTCQEELQIRKILKSTLRNQGGSFLKTTLNRQEGGSILSPIIIPSNQDDQNEYANFLSVDYNCPTLSPSYVSSNLQHHLNQSRDGSNEQEKVVNSHRQTPSFLERNKLDESQREFIVRSKKKPILISKQQINKNTFRSAQVSRENSPKILKINRSQIKPAEQCVIKNRSKLTISQNVSINNSRTSLHNIEGEQKLNDEQQRKRFQPPRSPTAAQQQQQQQPQSSRKHRFRTPTANSPYQFTQTIQFSGSNTNDIGIMTNINTPMVRRPSRLRETSDKRTEMFQHCYANALKQFRETNQSRRTPLDRRGQPVIVNTNELTTKQLQGNSVQQKEQNNQSQLGNQYFQNYDISVMISLFQDKHFNNSNKYQSQGYYQ